MRTYFVNMIIEMVIWRAAVVSGAQTETEHKGVKEVMCSMCVHVAPCVLTTSPVFCLHLCRSLRSALRTLPGVNTWCSWAARCWPTSWKTRIPSGWAGQSTRKKAWECCKNWGVESDKNETSPKYFNFYINFSPLIGLKGWKIVLLHSH